MDINLLVKLTSRAWSLSILALMHTGVAGRQAPLLAATGAGRTAFAHSLAHLIDLELLERNPGHGHPLRPEFRLTAKGTEIAGIAARIVGNLPGHDGFVLLRRAWTVPVLAVTGKPRYFSEIRSDLFSITDRALSKSLRQLEQRKWLLREVDLSKRPLRPTYQAANFGASISRAVRTQGQAMGSNRVG